MIKLLCAAALPLLITGCMGEPESHLVDCMASYWPEGAAASVPINVIKMRSDSYGNIEVMPQTALMPEISNTWQDKSRFNNYQCNGISYGLAAYNI